ncbi:MAG: KpsF/GutQ family sugar-phosphate isomerase [Acidobacteriota bacterium]
MSYVKTAKKVLEIEAEAIRELIPRLDENFAKAVELIAKCTGRVVLTGMGKSGIICHKIAATLASTGTPALFMHPAEAIHGDLGMIAAGDVVIAISNSGETEELLRLLETIKRLDVRLISMTGDPESTLARHSDIALNVGIKQEACPMGLVPTASTTASLAMGDALALALAEKKGFTADDFAMLHPGGKLGKKLMKVENLMHVGDEMPVVTISTLMREVILEMTRKKLGVTTVLDEQGRLVGILTDGDLRRLLEREKYPLEKKIEDCMTRTPVTISRNELATAALNIMEARKITSIPVVNSEGRLEGIIQIHDLWRIQMF